MFTSRRYHGIFCAKEAAGTQYAVFFEYRTEAALTGTKEPGSPQNRKMSEKELDTKALVDRQKENHEEKRIDKIRSQSIIERNSFILNYTNDLTPRQMKLAYLFLSQLEPGSDELAVTMDLKTVLQTLGLTLGGSNRAALKKQLAALRSGTFWINTRTPKGKTVESAVGFADRVDIIDESQCTIHFSSATREYFGNTEGGNFALYAFEAMLALPDRKERMNLLRLCMAEGYKGEFEISLEELRAILGCEEGKYAEFKDFHKQILKPGVADINSFSGISVSYHLNRLGRRCNSITFYVAKKTTAERYTAHIAAKAQIEGRLIV